jgi:hypothetical protein
MQRKEFLTNAAGFISAATLLSFKSKTGIPLGHSLNKNSPHRDAYRDFTSPILQAIAIGLQAPSAHNTQAWKCKLIGDTEMLLYVDEQRLLPQTDPPARQIHISCGCFLEAVSLGCTGIGYEAAIHTFPEGDYNFDAIGKKPVAHIVLTKNNSVQKHPLFDYIFERRTNRSVHKDEVIDTGSFDQIRNSCTQLYTGLHIIKSSDAVEQHRAIFSKAMEKEFHTLATNEETRRLFRFNEEEAASKRDGLTFESSGLSGMGLFLARIFTKNSAESWNKATTVNKGLANFNKGLDSARAFVLWTTPSNTYLDMINTGRDFYQYSLAAIKQQYYFHPLNQANQEYREMDALREQLDTMTGIQAPAKIQMIVRMGKAGIPFESYRRHVENFIVNKETEIK